MASTAEALMLRARDTHAAFTPAQTPDVVLLRYLARARDNLYQDALRIYREAFTLTVELPFTPTTLADGLDLPPAVWVGNLRVRVSAVVNGVGETWPLTQRARAVYVESVVVPPYAVVEPRYRLTPPATQGQYVDVLALYPKASGVWDTAAAVLADYVPRLTPVTSLSTRMELPDECEDVLIGDMAAFMARRDRSTDKASSPNVRQFDADARDLRNSYLQLLAQRRKPLLTQVREG